MLKLILAHKKLGIYLNQETLDYTIRIGSKQTFLYFDLHCPFSHSFNTWLENFQTKLGVFYLHHHFLQGQIQTGLSGLYKPVRFLKDKDDFCVCNE